jgi:hypothetical protein
MYQTSTFEVYVASGLSTIRAALGHPGSSPSPSPKIVWTCESWCWDPRRPSASSWDPRRFAATTCCAGTLEVRWCRR